MSEVTCLFINNMYMPLTLTQKSLYHSRKCKMKLTDHFSPSETLSAFFLCR